MKRILTYLIATLLCLPAPGAAGILPRHEELQVGRLQNGLTYYIYPTSSPKGEAVYRLFIKSGSLNERDDQRGLAHFLEHLAFNGTENFPDDGIVRFMSRHGGRFGQDLNAHTSYDETVYKFQSPSINREVTDSVLMVLSDIAGGLLIAPQRVEKEKGIIIAEWRQRHSGQNAAEAFLEEIVGGTRFAARRTIGDTSIIRNASPDVLRDYYRRWYHPSLMAVAVAGDIDPEHIREQIQEKFSSLGSVNPPRPEAYPIPPYKSSSIRIVYDTSARNASLDILQRASPMKPVRTEEAYKEALMHSITGKLIKQRFSGLIAAETAYLSAGISSGNLFGRTMIHDFAIKLEKGKALEGISNALANADRIFRYGFTSAEIDKAGRELLHSAKGRMRSGGKLSSAAAIEKIYADFHRGDLFISPETEFYLTRKYLPAMDSAAIMKHLKHMRRQAPWHVLMYAPENMREEIGTEKDLAKLLNKKRSRPAPPSSKDFKLSGELLDMDRKGEIVSESRIPELDITDWRLANGARVIYRRSPSDSGQIRLSGFRKGGLYALDTADYRLGVFASALMPEYRVGEFSREELSYALAGNSARMRLLIDKTRTGVAGSANAEDMETMFQLLHLKWTGTRPDMEFIRRAKKRFADMSKTRQPDKEKDFARHMNAIVNGKSYVNDDEGAIMSLDEGRIPYVLNRMYGSAKDYVFIITSSMPATAIRDHVETYIATLPEGPVDTEYRYVKRDIPKDPVIRISKAVSPSDKATVSLVFQHEDRPQMSMQEEALYHEATKMILRTSLLHTLREKMGKVYSVSVSSNSGLHPSYLSRTSIMFSCAEEDCDSLISTTLTIMSVLASAPKIMPAAMEPVKKAIMKEHLKSAQGITFFTSTTRNMIFNGEEDWSRIEGYPKLIESLDPERMREFLKRISESPRIESILLPEKRTSGISDKETMN